MEENKKKLFGIVGGSSLLKSSFMSNLTKIVVETDHGAVSLYKSDTFVFCQRHGVTLAPYVPPHLIPHVAIVTAFKKLGVERVVAFGSTGSLKV